MIATFCRASSPPANSTTDAKAAMMKPHTNLTTSLGFKAPPVDILPRTNDAESAEVIKNTLTRAIAKIDVTVASGYCSRVINSALVTFSDTALVMAPPVWRSA